MKRSVSFLAVVLFVSVLSGCLLSKTPSTNDVTMTFGEEKTFSVNIFPSKSTYTWTLDGDPQSNTGKSYVYTCLGGNHTLTVKAKHICGTDTVTWNIKNLTWNKTFGGSGQDSARSIMQTSDGGYIVGGGTFSYGTGDSDGWLIKINANGKEEWNRTFGGIGVDEINSIQQTSDGGYILTGWTGAYGAGDLDVWLIKTDEDGNKSWDKTFGGLYEDYPYSVQQTKDGGYIIAGTVHSYGAGYLDVWLIKTDASGNTCDYSINGNCYENDSRWVKTFGGPNEEISDSVIQTNDGGYILSADTISYGAGGRDSWLIKTDASGNKIWDKTFGGPNDDYCPELQLTADGGYILAGSTDSFGAGGTDSWLIKTDANGNKVWDKTFGGPNFDRSYGVQQTTDGGYILAGYTDSYGAGRMDLWLLKTDSDGNKVWDKTFGGASNDAFSKDQTLKATKDGGFILAGTTLSYGAGDADFWIIKTDKDGNAPATPSP
jgi:hypothetical protein